MSRGQSGTDVSSLIRGNSNYHSNYLLGREAINELKIENQQLNYENNKLRTDLDVRNIQITSLKRKLWEKGNEFSQVISERDWFQRKTQNLEYSLHNMRSGNAINGKKINPFLEQDKDSAAEKES